MLRDQQHGQHAKMFKFIHAADIHLDSPLVGLERYDGVPADRVRQAPRAAFDNLVQLALDEQVAFVLIAGDLYDRGWRHYDTCQHLANQMARLCDAGIHVFIIAGNHDAYNKAPKILRFHKLVEMFKVDEPDRKRLDEVNVTIHGQGFAAEEINDDLSAKYLTPDPGRFNIGLLHTCAGVVSDVHKNYAPCTVDGLVNKGYQYWALGHIHQRRELHTDPYVIFPGNIQGRDIGETGAKGCYLVTVDDKDKVQLDFRPLDVMRWQECSVDAAGAANCDQVMERVHDELVRKVQNSDGLPIIARVVVDGACAAHAGLHADPNKLVAPIRSLASTLNGELWIERVKLETTPASATAAIDLEGPLQEVLAVLRDMGSDVAKLDVLRAEIADLERKLPQQLRDCRRDAICIRDDQWLRSLLEQVEPMLVGRLLGTEDVL